MNRSNPAGQPRIADSVDRTAPLRRRTAWNLYAAIASLYLLTASGRIGGADELAVFNVAQSLATQASVSADTCVPEAVHLRPKSTYVAAPAHVAARAAGARLMRKSPN